jgi:hypothetical protein
LHYRLSSALALAYSSTHVRIPCKHQMCFRRSLSLTWSLKCRQFFIFQPQKQQNYAFFPISQIVWETGNWWLARQIYSVLYPIVDREIWFLFKVVLFMPIVTYQGWKGDIALGLWEAVASFKTCSSVSFSSRIAICQFCNYLYRRQFITRLTCTWSQEPPAYYEMQTTAHIIRLSVNRWR